MDAPTEATFGRLPPGGAARLGRPGARGATHSHAVALAMAAAAAALLGACAPTTKVVLLPEPDGRPTAVTVTDSRGEVVLDHPYATAERSRFGRTRTYDSAPADVQRDFGAALAAQPRREMSTTVHFDEGKDTLTDESRARIDDVLAEVAKRPIADVLVVGHTDRVGTDAVNDALAKQRAETVRAELIRRGLPPANVQASGRGSREPVVPTPPGVAEPRNRRVDIIVR